MDDARERPSEVPAQSAAGNGSLAPSAELFQTVLDSLTHPFYVIDVHDYSVRLANRAARREHGQGQAACYALTQDRERPCSEDGRPCPVEIIRRTHRPVVVEHVLGDRRQRRRHVQVHGFPVFDGDGVLRHVIEYRVDITEHKNVVARHKWELAVNKAIVELADALLDPTLPIEQIAAVVLEQARRLTASEHGYVSSIDPETKASLGHTLTAMMGRQCLVSEDQQQVTFLPDETGHYPGLWGYALNTGEGFFTNDPAHHPGAAGLPAGHVPIENFLTVPAIVGREVVGQIALAGSERPYSDRELEAIGRMAKLYALAVRQRRIDTALKKSKERYALAQTAANIGSWDWNIVTGALVWSARIEPLFGFARGQFAGPSEAFLAHVHPADRPHVVDAVRGCVERGMDYRIEHRIVWPDGTVRWVSETGDVVRDSDGKAIRMLGVVQDITERKAAEREIRQLNERLEQRVQQRTAALTEANAQLREQIAQRRRLEREILEISEREQRRMGQELHDSLGQQLTGIAIISKVLQQKLRRAASDAADTAGEIARLVNEAVSQTRQLSHGLHPVALDEKGLMSALQALATTTERVFGVACAFRCDRPVLVRNTSIGTHLYRIAQEAVTNAVRHGKAGRIWLRLSAENDRAFLTIENDGRDFPARLPRGRGMGLQVMNYRAEMIGGTLIVERRPEGGTRVICTCSLHLAGNQGEKDNVREETRSR
jgi:PAS domain S-box-containing protein